MTDWKTWTPKYDGHAPDDWDGGPCNVSVDGKWMPAPAPFWTTGFEYRYRAKQPDLLAQCLALPQADRDALIAELQKPVRDWADDVWAEACRAYGLLNSSPERVDAAAVIRSMCRPKSISETIREALA